jgi:hypothetical protein
MRLSSLFTLSQTPIPKGVEEVWCQDWLRKFLVIGEEERANIRVDSARRLMPSPKAGGVSNKVLSSWCRWRLGRSRKRPLLYIPIKECPS